ncbi:MAG: acyl-CoA desaturase [Cytophagaceae bacterium]|jgi:linoleoyl-CoA desaturase|nr:acyl-CoA desaturase [Cytophagaceae bacterium]
MSKIIKVRFVDKNKSEFYATLKERVDSYFKQNNLSKNANGLMYFKSFFFLGGVFLFYGLIISNQFSAMTMLGFAVLLGMFKAFVGFNVSHDAIHGSYSSDDRINKLMGYSFNIIGASKSVWNVSHNIVHHTYTNIPGHDEDLEIAPGLVRVSEHDKKYWIQRFQHVYAFMLYGLASLSWVFRKDYVKFFSKTIGHHDNTHHTVEDYIDLFLFKILYYVNFIVLPLVFLDITWYQFIIGFLCMHIAEGLVLGLVFQLAHVVEGAEFPEPNEQGNIEEAWAVHQMKTTANFACESWLASFLCGGLNMQVEHHLFPKVCHTHYPKLSKIVRETAREFNVPYIENKTFIGALKSHYLMLRHYGLEAQQTPALAGV